MDRLVLLGSPVYTEPGDHGDGARGTARRRNQPVPRLAVWSLGAGIVATVGANLTHGVGHGPVGALVSAWPALALVGSFELLMMLIRIGRGTRPGEAEPEPWHQVLPPLVQEAPPELSLHGTYAISRARVIASRGHCYRRCEDAGEHHRRGHHVRPAGPAADRGPTPRPSTPTKAPGKSTPSSPAALSPASARSSDPCGQRASSPPAPQASGIFSRFPAPAAAAVVRMPGRRRRSGRSSRRPGSSPRRERCTGRRCPGRFRRWPGRG